MNTKTIQVIRIISSIIFALVTIRVFAAVWQHGGEYILFNEYVWKAIAVEAVAAFIYLKAATSLVAREAKDKMLKEGIAQEMYLNERLSVAERAFEHESAKTDELLRILREQEIRKNS